MYICMYIVSMSSKSYSIADAIVSSPVSKVPDPAVVERLRRHGHECAIAAPV